MRWPMVPLGAIAEIVGGSTPSREVAEYWDGSIPWVTPTDLPMPGKGIAALKDTDTAGRITEQGLASSAANLLPLGTVLFSSRATIGKLAITEVPAATNQGFANFIPGPAVYNRYLAWALQFHTPNIERLAGSTTFKEVTKTALKAFRIPLPSLSEQRRIVEILDQANRLLKLRREADAKCSQVLPALFIMMFGDPTANPRKLRKKPLGELIRVKSGEFLPTREMAIGGEFPVYGGNGISGYHDKYMFEEAKIVLGRVGAYCGAVHYTTPKAWITDNALYVSEKFENLDDLYLVTALRLANLNQYAGRAGQPLISGSRIYPIEILIPHEREQQSFARSTVILQGLDAQRFQLSQKLDRIWASLMQRAFSGLLTAHWRETRIKELVAEIEQQMNLLNLPPTKLARLATRA